MGQTLTNGLYLPAEGERNCYSGLESNWRALDAVIGGYNTHIANLDIHVTTADKNSWNGHVANGDIHVTAADKTGWNGHVGNSDIHVTAADKTGWNNHVGNSDIHVTAADKAKWDTVTSKVNDSDVVHKAGAETIAGPKTFSDTVTVPSINGLNTGALSLPNLSAGVDISGYITAGVSHNEYTPTVDGWISVTIKKTSTTGALALFIYQGDICNSFFGNTSLPNESEFSGMASIPVKAGIVVNIDTKGTNTYIYSAKFYPCTGNV